MADSAQEAFDCTAAMLRQQDAGTEQCRKTFENYVDIIVGADLAFQHNMGVLAAKGGLEREAFAIGMDLLEGGHPGTAAAISAAGLEYGEVRAKPVYLELLRAAIDVGHFRSKSLLWGERSRRFGLLGFVFLIPVRMLLAARAGICALSNPMDIRLDRGPKL